MPMKRQRKSRTKESSLQPTRKRATTSDSSGQAKKPRSKKTEAASLTSNSLISTPMRNDVSTVISTPMSNDVNTVNSNSLITSLSCSKDQSNPVSIFQSENNTDYVQSVAYPIVSMGNQYIPAQSLDSIPPPPLLNPLENASEIFENIIAPFIHANNEIQLIIKTRIYRHIFLTHCLKEIRSKYSNGINMPDLILLTLDVMKSIGLF